MMMMIMMMMEELVMQSTTWSVTTVLTQYETLPIHCKMVDTRVCVWLAQSHQVKWEGHRTHQIVVEWMLREREGERQRETERERERDRETDRERERERERDRETER